MRTSRSNEDCGQTIHRTNLKRVSKSLDNFLAASIKYFENPSIFDRFIVKKLSLRLFLGHITYIIYIGGLLGYIYIYTYVYIIYIYISQKLQFAAY